AWLVVPSGVARAAALPVATAVRPSRALAQEPLAREDLERVEQAIGRATHPLLVAGRGCRIPTVSTWLRAFAEALPAPVLVTPAGRGALPDPHPLCHGLLAREAAILQRADIVLALGVDDDELAAAGVTLATAPMRVSRV